MATRLKPKATPPKSGPLPEGVFTLPKDGPTPKRAFRLIEKPEVDIEHKVSITPQVLGEYMVDKMTKAVDMDDLQVYAGSLERQVAILKEQVEALGGTPKEV